MADALGTVAPAFVAMAHRIVWATGATTDTAGNPSTRILHPVWEWDGTTLTGWIATSPLSLKAEGLRMAGGSGQLLMWKRADPA